MAFVTLTATAIRADMVARLLAANVAGGAGHVFDSRLIDVEHPDLPAVFVLSGDPTIEKLASNATFYKRVEKCGAYGICTATTDAALGEALDDLEDAIEVALLGDPEWAGSFGDFKIEVNKTLNLSSARRVGGVSVVLVCEYEWQPPVPAGATAPLEGVDVTTEPQDPAGADVSERTMYEAP